MITTPSDRNSANRPYWRTLAFAAAIVATVSSCSFATYADAKQKKHHGADATTSTPKAAAGAAPTPSASDPAKAPADSDKTDAQAAAKPADAWSEAEIADARAHCTVVLQRIHAVAQPHAPIREGACGAPAPIELISIGQNPEVTLSPPAIVRCDLAEELVNWFEKDVQPLALKHLKSPIVRIETMSSYSCRNAYGRKSTKLSEHALANALDIGGFVTASAENAEVLDDWGKPQRERRQRTKRQPRRLRWALQAIRRKSRCHRPSLRLPPQRPRGSRERPLSTAHPTRPTSQRRRPFPI